MVICRKYLYLNIPPPAETVSDHTLFINSVGTKFVLKNRPGLDVISVAPSPAAASTVVGGRSKVLNKSNSFSGGGGSTDISAPGGSVVGPSSHKRGQLCSAGNLVASSSHQGTSSNKKG